MIQFRAVTKSQLSGMTVDSSTDQIIFVTDALELWFDRTGVRSRISDVIYLQTEDSRTAISTPLDKMYFVLESQKLWYYTENHWVCLNDSGTDNDSYDEFAVTSAYDLHADEAGLHKIKLTESATCDLTVQNIETAGVCRLLVNNEDGGALVCSALTTSTILTTSDTGCYVIGFGNSGGSVTQLFKTEVAGSASAAMYKDRIMSKMIQPSAGEIVEAVRPIDMLRIVGGSAYGLTAGFGGSVKVDNSATLYGAEISAGGCMTVESGGSLENTLIRGHLTVSGGVVSNATVLSGGVMTMTDQGSAAAPRILSGGRIELTASCAVTSMIVESGGIIQLPAVNNTSVTGASAGKNIHKVNGSLTITDGGSDTYLSGTYTQLGISPRTFYMRNAAHHVDARVVNVSGAETVQATDITYETLSISGGSSAYVYQKKALNYMNMSADFDVWYNSVNSPSMVATIIGSSANIYGTTYSGGVTSGAAVFDFSNCRFQSAYSTVTSHTSKSVTSSTLSSGFIFTEGTTGIFFGNNYSNHGWDIKKDTVGILDRNTSGTGLHVEKGADLTVQSSGVCLNVECEGDNDILIQAGGDAGDIILYGPARLTIEGTCDSVVNGVYGVDGTKPHNDVVLTVAATANIRALELYSDKNVVIDSKAKVDELRLSYPGSYTFDNINVGALTLSTVCVATMQENTCFEYVECESDSALTIYGQCTYAARIKARASLTVKPGAYIEQLNMEPGCYVTVETGATIGEFTYKETQQAPVLQTGCIVNQCNVDLSMTLEAGPSWRFVCIKPQEADAAITLTIAAACQVLCLRARPNCVLVVNTSAHIHQIVAYASTVIEDQNGNVITEPTSYIDNITIIS